MATMTRVISSSTPTVHLTLISPFERQLKKLEQLLEIHLSPQELQEVQPKLQQSLGRSEENLYILNITLGYLLEKLRPRIKQEGSHSPLILLYQEIEGMLELSLPNEISCQDFKSWYRAKRLEQISYISQIEKEAAQADLLLSKISGITQTILESMAQEGKAYQDFLIEATTNQQADRFKLHASLEQATATLQLVTSRLKSFQAEAAKETTRTFLLPPG